jgi:hypothetical protein
MNTFISRFAHVVLGVLSGLDRVMFRGTLRSLCRPMGLQNYLWTNKIPFKDFDRHSQEVTQRLEAESLREARALGREIRYLPSSQTRKEDVAREIAARDGISEGLICVLRCVEPCMSFQITYSHATKKLEIRYRPRQCIHLYHYHFHPVFGFMHARLQTWFPFRVYVYLNGREWLARQMDREGLGYRRRDNCFTWLENSARAQALAQEQLRIAWPQTLDAIRRSLHPTHEQIFAGHPLSYYWSLHNNEWATDVMFRSRADLTALYSRWVRHGITTFGAAHVLRFLGRKIAATDRVPAPFNGEVTSDVQHRQDGVRLKHWHNHNALKMYDKGSVLRVELTINDPNDFRVYRPKEGDADGPKAWRPLRTGVADLHRRAHVSQAANERYLEALATVTHETPLRALAEPLCAPAPAPANRSAAGNKKPPVRRVRALNPLAKEDAALLEAVARPEFMQNGLRNRDLRRLLYATPADAPDAERRRSAAVSRKLRLLRAHGLLQKVPKTHRYTVSNKGRQAITALLAARNASIDQLTKIAA